jgi:hypothetical protein
MDDKRGSLEQSDFSEMTSSTRCFGMDDKRGSFEQSDFSEMAELNMMLQHG